MINDATLPSCGCWGKTRELSNRNTCSKAGQRRELCALKYLQIQKGVLHCSVYSKTWQQKLEWKVFPDANLYTKPTTLQKPDTSLANCSYILKHFCMHPLTNSLQSDDLHKQLWGFFQVSRSFNSAQLLRRPLKIWPVCFIYKHIKWTSRLI